MSQIDRQSTIKTGDTVFTSGENGKGSNILIGEIGTTLTEDRDTYQTVEITPAVNFRNLSVVFVLIP